MIDQLSRRGFLVQGASAAVGASLAASMIASAETERVVDPNWPAAAAGSLWIGGDMQVSRLGFGAMRITGEGIWGEPRDTKEARAVLRRALQLGSNFIDTADAYGPSVSERLIKEALYPYPRGLLIATKGGLVRPGPGVWNSDGRPEHLRAACESSLQRLGLERIDLYQMHKPDPQIPYEDSIGALAKLQQEGKIRHIGLSNVNTTQLAQARSLIKVVSVQNRYNVADRDSEDVLGICQRDRIAFLPWAPLAQRAQGNANPDPRIAALTKIADQRRINLSQATLAWLLAKSPVMLPIPGTSRVAHLEENIAAARIKFSASEMAQIG